MRHAAQCIGRVLRGKTDYGLMIFADKVNTAHSLNVDAHDGLTLVVCSDSPELISVPNFQSGLHST
jgi:hypothetical protein